MVIQRVNLEYGRGGEGDDIHVVTESEMLWNGDHGP